MLPLDVFFEADIEYRITQSHAKRRTEHARTSFVLHLFFNQILTALSL